MKKQLIYFTALILFLIPLTSHSQNGIVSLDHVEGLVSADTIAPGSDISFHIRFNNNTDDTIVGSTNGFRIYSPDGAKWSLLTVNYDSALINEYGGNVFIGIYSDGSISDTIGFGGFQYPPDAGIVHGYDSVVFSISTSIDDLQRGKTICIDSSFYPVVGKWLWSSVTIDDFIPEWDGPHCFFIEELTTDVAVIDKGIIPDRLTLLQNYSNPFNPETNISFLLPEKSSYQLLIYNSLGQQIESFAGIHSAGIVEITWDASLYASGLYFYKITAGKETLTKKMLLLK